MNVYVPGAIRRAGGRAEYRQLPEYKAYQRAYNHTPEHKAEKKAYNQAYNHTPEYKAKKKAYNQAYNHTPEHKAEKKAYNKAYNHTPEYKAKKKAYMKTPEQCKCGTWSTKSNIRAHQRSAKCKQLIEGRDFTANKVDQSIGKQ